MEPALDDYKVHYMTFLVEVEITYRIHRHHVYLSGMLKESISFSILETMYFCNSLIEMSNHCVWIDAWANRNQTPHLFEASITCTLVSAKT